MKKIGNKKKHFILVLVILIIIVAGITGIFVSEHIKAENSLNEWKGEAVAEPVAGKLMAAGNIDISILSIEDIYMNADKFGDIDNYTVYINDTEAAVLSEKDFQKDEINMPVMAENSKYASAKRTVFEYHASKTDGYEIYVEVNFENGTKIYSDIFTFYVSKKGMCVNKNMGRYVDAKAMNASWYYNWDLTPFGFSAYKDLEYVPMMWGYNDTNASYLQRLPKLGYKYILSYNEPDRVDQADITVEKAVDSWKDFSGLDAYVSSPATALCPVWSDEWFQPFMKGIKNEVDFVAVHHYWNWYDDEGVKAFLKLIDDSYEMYKKPIWITEFAIDGDPGKNEEQLNAVYGYMEGVLKGLEERDYVERYAWFSFSKNDDRNGASALFDMVTGELTELGKLYTQTGNPEGYNDKNVKNVKSNNKQDKIQK